MPTVTLCVQVSYVVLRHMTSLHRVYAFYSRLGHVVNPDNVFIMTRMQFWRLLKDCQLHYNDYGLADMDRWLGTLYLSSCVLAYGDVIQKLCHFYD